MAFPNSGSVSLNAFADEVGDSDNTHSMSEFYRKAAGPVYDIGDNSDIPTSGAISFSQLRGTSGVVFRSTSQGVQDNPAGANTLAAYFNSADRSNKVCHLTVDTTIGANASISTGNFASGDPLYVDINSTNGAIHGAPGNTGSAGSMNTTNGVTSNSPAAGNQGGHGLTIDGNQTVKLSPGSDNRIIGGGGGGGGAGIYNAGLKGTGTQWSNPNTANPGNLNIIPPNWSINQNLTTSWSTGPVNWNAGPGASGGNVSQAHNNATQGTPPVNFADNNSSGVSSYPGNAGSAGQAGNPGTQGTAVAPAEGSDGASGTAQTRNPRTFTPNAWPTYTVNRTYSPLSPTPTSGWGLVGVSNFNLYSGAVIWRSGMMAHSHSGIYSGNAGSLAMFYQTYNNQNSSYDPWTIIGSNSNHYQVTANAPSQGNTGTPNSPKSRGNIGNPHPPGSGGAAGQRYPGTPANTHSNVSFGDLDPGTNP